MIRPTAFFISSTAALTLSAGAATLSQYQFTGNYNNSLTLPAGLSSAGPISLAAGLTGNTPSNAAGVGISGNPANTLFIRSSILYSAEPVEKTAATAIASADYFTFELTIASGYTLDLNNVSLDVWSSTAAPTDSYTSNFAVYYTTGSTPFSSEAAAVKLGETSAPNTTSSPFSFTENLAGNEALTGTVRFHFVFWDPANTNLDNRVTRLDNITVDGVLSPIPEPSTASLAALTLLPMLRRRR